MPRYRLSIAYDGSAFCGWQRQLMPIDLARAHGHDTATPDADGRIELRSVQSSIIRAIRDVTLQTVNLVGASRTDAGVHARAQTAAFTLTETDGEKRRGPADDRLAAALNSRLPEDVVVRSAVRTTDDFDPIAGCLAKGYSYLFHVEHPRPLWDRPYVHHVRENLSAAAMADAAQAFIGTHDFAAFAAAGHGRDSTLRTVIHCAAHESVSSFGERRIRIDIAADGFLWNMVRIIAGTLMEVGKGRLTPDAIRSALQSGDRRAAGPTLPPTGLCLEWGAYSEAELADRTRDLAIAPELLDAVRASAVERKRRNAEWAARNDGDGDGGGVFHVEHPEHDATQPEANA